MDQNQTPSGEDLLAELSALQVNLQKSKKETGKKEKPKNPASSDAKGSSVIDDDFLSDIRAFRAKPRKKGKKEEAPKSKEKPAANPKLEIKKAPKPSPAPEKPAPERKAEPEVKPGGQLGAMDIDIPLIDEDSDALAPLPTPGSRKKKARPMGNGAQELSYIRQQLEDAIARLRALEGSGQPVAIGAMTGSPKKAKPSYNGSAVETLSARDMRSVKRDVDNIVESARRTTLEDEMNTFNELVLSVPGLNFMQHRMTELVDRGEMDLNVLVALYRTATRFMQAEIAQREKDLTTAQNDFKKYKKSMKKLGNVLSGKKEMPGYENGGVGGEEEKVDSGELFVLRETLKKKDQVIEQFEKRVEGMKKDFNNFRQRQKKEVDLKISKEKETMILDLLEVVDNFERALFGKHEAVNPDAMLQGFQMIYESLMSSLKKHGLKEIDAEFQKFDPFFHEAMMREENLEHPDGTVLEVLRKGYILGEKMVRPARVKTSVNPNE